MSVPADDVDRFPNLLSRNQAMIINLFFYLVYSIVIYIFLSTYLFY